LCPRLAARDTLSPHLMARDTNLPKVGGTGPCANPAHGFIIFNLHFNFKSTTVIPHPRCITQCIASLAHGPAKGSQGQGAPAQWIAGHPRSPWAATQSIIIIIMKVKVTID
jgi:hypothetical protein